MAIIRIPDEHWDEVWFALVDEGPISRVSPEPIYRVSERHIKMLKRKKLPFEVVSPKVNGRRPERPHG